MTSNEEPPTVAKFGKMPPPSRRLGEGLSRTADDSQGPVKAVTFDEGLIPTVPYDERLLPPAYFDQQPSLTPTITMKQQSSVNYDDLAPRVVWERKPSWTFESGKLKFTQPSDLIPVDDNSMAKKTFDVNDEQSNSKSPPLPRRPLPSNIIEQKDLFQKKFICRPDLPEFNWKPKKGVYHEKSQRILQELRNKHRDNEYYRGRSLAL